MFISIPAPNSSKTESTRGGIGFLALVFAFLLGNGFLPAFAQDAELLVVHALPGGAEATWFVNDEAFGNTSELGTTLEYVSIPVGEITLSASVGEVASEAVMLEARANQRYVAYLHAGPGGLPAIVTGAGFQFAIRDGEQLARAVNLVPTAENVKSYDSAECDGNDLPALSYGSVGRYRDVGRPFSGPSTLCGDDGIEVTLARIAPEDGWQIAPSTVRSFLLIEVDGEAAVLLIEETP
jgi:hypothetical protein